MLYALKETARRNVIDVLVYASYRLILDSFETLLATSGEINVTGGSTKLDELKRLLTEKKPSVVVLCFMEDEWANIEVISELQAACPASRVLVVTWSEDVDGQLRAVHLGANGVMSKNQDGRMLVRAIRQIHDGETWFNQKLIARFLKNDSPSRNVRSDRQHSGLEVITKRELEIIGLIARGMRNKLIAQELSISEATVRHHLSSIYGKLDVEDRLNLVIYAYQHRMIA